MPYSEQQKAFYVKAKEAGWAPEKIRAGIIRIGEKEGGAAANTPPPSASQPRMTAGPTWQETYKKDFENMSKADQFLYGGAAVPLGWKAAIKQMLGMEGADEEAKNIKEIKNITGSTVAGGAGEFAYNVAPTLLPAGAMARGVTAAGKYGVPAAMAMEGALGAGMSALNPTTEEGERAENMMWGGGLGALFPAGGELLRRSIGKVDPMRKAAAETLKKVGVSIPKADEMSGWLGKMSGGILNRTPGTSDIIKHRVAAKQDKVADALFAMLGKDRPQANEGMQEILEDIGEKVGSHYKGTMIHAQDFAKEVSEARTKYAALGDLRKPEITKLLDKYHDMTQNPNAVLRGSTYGPVRSELSRLAQKAEGAHAEAYRGLRNAIDKAGDEVLAGKGTLAAKQAADAKYRLAKQLSKVDIKKGEFDVHKARNYVEKAAKRAPVMPEARKLLDASDLLLPKASGTNLANTSTAAVLALLTSPQAIATAIGGGLGVRGALNTGLPQQAANSEAMRKLTAAILRGSAPMVGDED